MEVTRRNFLRTATVVGMGAFAASAMSACSSADDSSEEVVEQVEHNPSSFESFDVVVVGSGTAGTCAALRAAELGASVVCLEKRSALGGTSTVAEGLCGINSRYQQEQGISIDASDVLQDTMEYHHYACLGPVVRKFVDTCGSVVDWLEDQGVAYASVAALGNSYQVWHLPADETGATTHMDSVLSVLQDRAASLGVEFRTETPMTGLVSSDDGSITGVYALQDDDEIEIDAQAVILATGGYAYNSEMFEKFTGRPYDSVRVWGFEGRDGDGISFATEFGADTHLPSAVMYHTGAIDGTSAFSDVPNFVLTKQPTLHVNEKAERYFNESITSNFSATGNVLTTQAENYVIFDDAYIDYIEENGPFSPMPNLGAFVGEPYECRDGITSCSGVVSADTIEGVAEALDLDPETLAATVERYNNFCESGLDEDYGKPAEQLLSVSTPPFYGAKITPTLFTTVGGLRVDENMHVMSTDGQIINGLYAAGGDAGGLYGANYDVDVCSGSQQGWAATSGYVAAETALA